jgi:hypothetical protein
MRHFLCFAREGKYYSYRAMPFGAKHAPRLFTEALGYAIRYIRTHWDIRIIAYKDDLLLLHQDKEHLALCTLQIAAYLSSLGWTISIKKCEFTPTQEIDFLGWHWSSPSLTLQMTRSMRHAILCLIHQWLNHVRNRDSVSSKAYAGLIGSLNFLRAQFPRASLYLRSLHSDLARMVASVGWIGSSTLTYAVRSELLFWWRNAEENKAYCFAQRVSQAQLTTDACEGGWAGHLGIGSLLLHTSGHYYPSDGLTSSNQCETAGVLRSLKYFATTLQQYQIHALTILCDNTVTVINLQRQGAGRPLLHLTRAIFRLLYSLDIRLFVSHIPGKGNDFVDALSRMEVTGDYSLKSDVYRNALQMLQV